MKSFMDISQEIAANFLQTAVIVDDRAFFGQEAPPVPMNPPGRGGSSQKNNEVEMDNPEKVVEGVKVDAHFLDAGATVEQFAMCGIVCSVLKPVNRGKEYFVDMMKALAKKTDLFVFDWSINKDNGDFIMDIIKTILKPIDKPGQQLLIAIYTGEKDLPGIVAKIEEFMNGNSIQCSISQEDEFCLIFENARVVVFAKPKTGTPSHERILEYEDVPKRLILEFARMTKGLISNMALSSLAALRKNTHRILRKFSSDLDPAYLTHRLLLSNPDGADQFTLDLIGAEIHSVIEDEADGDSEIENIKLHLDEREIGFKFNDTVIKLDRLIQALEAGPCLDEFKKTQNKDAATAMFAGVTLEEGRKIDERFSVLSIFKTKYDSKPRRLSLGTIISFEEINPQSSDKKQIAHEGDVPLPDPKKSPKYLVCLQPRCDSTRVTSERNFLFLPLTITKQTEPFDLVVDVDDGEYCRFKVNKKSFDVQLLPFGPAQDGVLSKILDKTHVFRDSNEKEYRWIAELKSDQALRLADEFSAAIGRVGLDEYEWLRLKKPS